MTTSGMLVKAANGRHYLIPASSVPSHMLTTQRVAVMSKNNAGETTPTNQIQGTVIKQPIVKLSPIQVATPQPPPPSSMQPLAAAVAQQLRTYKMNQAKPAAPVTAPSDPAESAGEEMDTDVGDLDLKAFVVPETEEAKRELRVNQLRNLGLFNEKHCEANPIYGEDLRDCMVNLYRGSSQKEHVWLHRSYETCQEAMWNREKCEATWPRDLLKTVEERTRELKPIFDNFVTFVPSVSAPSPILHVSHPNPSQALKEQRMEVALREEVSPKLNLLHPIMSAMSTQVSELEMNNERGSI